MFSIKKRAIITMKCQIRGCLMKRWYLAAGLAMVLCSPASLLAQNTGGNAAGTGAGGMNRGTTGSSTGGLAGTANTTLLGNQIDLNFNSVFGNQATLANTQGNVFAAYQPSGSGTGTGTGGRTGTGTGIGTTGINSSGFGGGTLGTNSLGGNTTGARTGTTGLNTTGLGGALGGGLGGGALGGNRNALGGGMNALGGNRNTMGGQGFLGGGTGIFGGGAAGNFLGSNANQQQQGNNTVGYMVNVDGRATSSMSAGTLTANTDIQQRLSGAPGLQGITNLQVMQQGTVAVLRGQVPSDYAKNLAAAMVRLEPGVYEVDNQLEVLKK